MRKLLKSVLSIMLVLMFSFTMILPAYAENTNKAELKALALKQIGLFKGVSEFSNDFDLDRAPTRVEAIVMLIRSLGKENEAINSDAKHPFTDVPAWANKYIGYAYEKGLTKGSSATSFGTTNASAATYLTFMLRALGYDDTMGDFVWDSPYLLAKAVGILPDDVDTENFLRADTVLISWAALEADIKGGSQRMAKKLISENVFTEDGYNNSIKLVDVKEPVVTAVSTVEELKIALADKSIKLISIEAAKGPVIVSDEIVIPKNVTLIVNRGVDFYIEGTLTNNGIIKVMGADTISENSINYAVTAVQNGGKFINNGLLSIEAATLSDTEDRGPVGGALRIFNGSFINNASVLLKKGAVNTHGGVVFVIEGDFTNNSLVIIDGFQIAIIKTFTNNNGAVIINNTYICTRADGTFTNNGIMTGYSLVKE